MTELSGSDILANARALAERIREEDLATQYDELRRLPDDLYAEVKASGVLRMNMPKIWGGPEMTSMEQVEVIEALSRADASLGWCAFIWCDSGIYSGYLDDAVAREMYPELDMATSGWVYPAGQAHRVEGGYEMSGQWMFGSGLDHCDWLVAGCTVYEDGEPHLVNGQPEWRILFARPSDYEIQDTWYTTGLRGTGSKDYRCEKVFVPSERSFSFLEPAPREGTIWRRPDHLLRKTVGVPLGVALETLHISRRILSDKGDRLSKLPYSEMPRVQSAIAEAHGRIMAARGYVFRSLEQQWRKIERDEPLTIEERADVWTSRTHAFQTCREMVALLYDTVGGNAIYTKRGVFDRHLRDLQTACQHVVGQRKGLEGVGGLLLGSAPPQTML